MSLSHRALALVLTLLFVWPCAPTGRACGPFSVQPVFVFRESPDLPFADFTRGKIGIVQPSFGRKTLVIAYRYLNGGSFNEEEQESLVAALSGQAPEDDGTEALKSWVAARKELLKENERLPEIYTERQRESYDFFPNCTKNAFEVATAALKDRVASYGSDDPNVHEWALGQDAVFQNCSGGPRAPAAPGSASPMWLRKDRDYQIAAAHFYSLNFDEARRRFESIAADDESPWQETARYLVPRTLVRQASLTENEGRKHELYKKAEVDLQNVMGQPKFYHAAQKLLALVKYRLHPEERVRELAGILANQGGNENLRQDLIDYVWLLDRFEARIIEEEKKRAEAGKPSAESEQQVRPTLSEEAKARQDAIQKGELISITHTFKKADGTYDYVNYFSVDVKPDISETELLLAFESRLGRKLQDDEAKEITERFQGALKYRLWLISPNRKWDNGGMSDYEGWHDERDKLTLKLIPDFLRSDDLSDWIFTLQTEDPSAYGHALAQWHDTHSRAWLVVAMVKAQSSSRNVDSLIRDGEKVARNTPEFPTVAHELVRLKVAQGRKEEARNLIDEVISTYSDMLPVSALNQFIKQRALIAESLTEFLKYSGRKPVAFYDYGRYGSLKDLLNIARDSWDSQYADQTKEDYENEVAERYKSLLPWDDRVAFDEETVDILNWHFPVQSLIDAARDRAVPPYLQRELWLAAWTRSILLDRDELALQISPEVIKAAPEIADVFNTLLRARTPAERHYAALFVLLKFPNLSPFVAGGIPEFSTAEDLNYYFQSAWWCALPTTEYDQQGQEVPKVVTRPGFLTREKLTAGQQERSQLRSIGDGKSYLGKQVLQWAKDAPDDPRIPEALFIAFNANQSYKYGCGGWEKDPEIQEQAESILRLKYPTNPWTAKLPREETR